MFIISCQTGKEDAKKFSDDYIIVTNKLKESRNKVKTRDEFVAYKEEKKKEFEALLKKFEKSPAIEEIEILRSNVLLQLEKLDEAEKKIDDVLAKKPDLINEAKMVKVKILFEREKFNEAYDIFKEIESEIKDMDDLFLAYYMLGSEHDDNNVKKEYSKKFLYSKDIPESHSENKYIMYLMLASVAAEEGDFDQALKLFKEGITETTDPRKKALLEKSLEQLDFIGKKAFPISSETWVNSSPLEVEKLKGKVVVVTFWAPWCPSCRKITPTLIEEYNKNKDQDFVLIGSTRLYGTYRDDVDDKGKVNKEEEIELIKNYVDRKKIPYPIAIADDKTNFDTYKIPGIPTLVFINKKGDIDFIKIGSGDQFIKSKIKKLLEES
jgi:thiol-disulfide isomerase/thioredoxin/GTP-sensing pleiotropic transcriptional regulator CodY